MKSTHDEGAQVEREEGEKRAEKHREMISSLLDFYFDVEQHNT